MNRSVKLIKSTVFGLVLLGLPYFGYSQSDQAPQRNREMHGDRMGNLENKIPDLTETQKTEIKEIHLSSKSEVKPLRSEIKVRHEKLKVLRTQENPNMDEINSLIDEMAVLKADIAKIEAQTHQDVRSKLTDTQKVVFDAEMQKKQEHVRQRAHE